MYRVRLLDAASKGLAKVDKPVARRIVDRVEWLAENLTDPILKRSQESLKDCSNCVSATIASSMSLSMRKS